MAARLIPLHQWAKITYGDSAPCMTTLRKWARGDKLDPPAEKHGREYFVTPDTRYAVEDKSAAAPEKVRRQHSNAVHESATQLISRIINSGSKTQTA